MRSKARSYFSLIELIVVVAILLVLISLLSPSLNNMISSSYYTGCAHQLKQLGTGSAIYVEDEGALPISLVNSSSALSPLFYINNNAEQSDAFEYMALNFFGAQDGIGTKNWKAGTRGALECPSKEVPGNGSFTEAWDVSYLSTSFLGSWDALRYGHDPQGRGYPQTRYGLTRVQNAEGYEIFGYRGSTRWEHPNQLSPKSPKKSGHIYPLSAQSPMAWPLFFDHSINSKGVYTYSSDNHGDSHGVKGMNVLYLDGSVTRQDADPLWMGNYAGKKTGNFTIWYLPYLRFSNFQFYDP